MLADIRDHRSSARRACDTLRVCPASGWGVVKPVEVDRCLLSAPSRAEPTVSPAEIGRLPDSAHLHLHYPDSLSPFPRPSPGSSACTLCRLRNGPSWHPSG